MLSVVTEGEFPPCPAHFNLADHVLAPALQAPERIALQILRPSGTENRTYGRLRAAVLGAATGFLGLGLAPGHRVLLRLGNTVEFPIAFLGASPPG